MHSLPLYTSRRLALLLLIGIPVITLVSVGHILSVQPDGVKVLKRDGSTITFTLPWKSIITPAASNVKMISPAANTYLDGITNVAEALTKGGILVGESGVKDGSSSLSILIKGVDGSLTAVQNNPVNTVVGQGELVKAGTSLVGQVLSTATSPSNVGALNTTKPTANSAGDHSDGCGCSVCGCSHSTFPPFANSTSGNSNITTPPMLLPTSSMMAMPMTACGVVPTVNETWHSTHYAETATMYSFMSIMTVTCTETVSSCPSSSYLVPNNMTAAPLQPTGLIQCMNGAFVQRKEDCPTTMMNNSTFPGSSSNPCYPCGECRTSLFCPPPTPAQSCPCGAGWPCADCSEGWYCPLSSSSIPGPTGNNALSSAISSVSLPAMTISSMSPNPVMNTTSLPPSTLSASAITNITSNFAQPTISRNTTASASPNVTSSLAQPAISPNVPFPNTTSIPILPTLLPTLLPNSTLSSANGSTIGNVTSQALSLPTLNGTMGLFSSSSAILVANTSVLLPTQGPTTTPLVPSLTGSLGTPSLPVNSTLLGSMPSVSLPLTTPALLTPAPSLPPDLDFPVQVSDYGARVLQGVESDVNEVLSSIDGLTGGLLSTVLAEIKSVLAVALQTAAPIPSRVDPALLALPLPTSVVDSLVASILPAASQAINNAVNAGGAAAALPLSVANGVVGNVLPTVTPIVNIVANAPPTASPIVNNVVVNASGAVAAVATPAAPPLGNNVVGPAGGVLAGANGAPRIIPA